MTETQGRNKIELLCLKTCSMQRNLRQVYEPNIKLRAKVSFKFVKGFFHPTLSCLLIYFKNFSNLIMRETVLNPVVSFNCFSLLEKPCVNHGHSR